jgi:putative spermidine/putrescine transport system ATP-binding protein/spermidine/putrescine transport system ATP-binding protein
MLSLIAGLIQPTGGRIAIDGRDVTHLPSGARNVGLVFQSYALFPNMTVFGNVAFPLEVRKFSRSQVAQRVEKALRLVRLSGFEARRPNELSGGQQQRVALARAIVFEPAILLLDEPLAALDRKLREEVRLELKRLQRALGLTTLLVTHDQDEALSLSDWIVVLDGGRVQQAGAPSDLYLRPSNRFVADFLGTANLFDGVLRRHGNDFVVALENGATVQVGRLSLQEGKRITAMVRPERIRLRPADYGNGVAATVLECIYHGPTVHYLVRLASGFEMIAMAQDPIPAYSPQAAVKLEWSSEDLWIIPENSSVSGAKSLPAEILATPAAIGEAMHDRDRQPRSYK